MDFKGIISKNGETIAPIVLFGQNRSQEVLLWHKKVMVDHFGFYINYVACPFPAHSHGFYMNYVINQTIDTAAAPDYYLFIENDAIFLKKSAIDFIYEQVSNKMTVFGQAWQSNHKPGPNGSVQHAYAGPATLCFARELYNKLGRPDLDHHKQRSDTAEELSYVAKEKGYCVSMIYPSHVEIPNTPLDNGLLSGRGNTYGENLMYHLSQQNHPESSGLFIQKCKDVISGKFENRILS